MISFVVRVQCCYGRSPFSTGACEAHTIARLTVEPVRDDEGGDLLKVQDVYIEPEFHWYDKAGIRHLYCPEHAKAVKL